MGLHSAAAERAERGTDPADPEIQDLAREWFAVVAEMTGDDRIVLAALYAKIDGQGRRS